MDHLPHSGISLIDVRDAMLDSHLLAGKLDLSILDALTASQPTCRPPIGCIAVTAAPCDQMSAKGSASPLTMRFNPA